MDEWDQLLELANLEAGIAGDDDARGAVTWVSVAEAEKTAGVSRSALRAWYRNAEVPSKVVDGPHGPTRLLALEAVKARARQSPRLQRKAKAAGVEEELAALRTHVDALRTRVDGLERRLAALEGGPQPG